MLKLITTRNDPLACARLSVTANKQTKQGSGEKASERASEKRRKDRRGKPVSIFLNNSVRTVHQPPPPPPPQTSPLLWHFQKNSFLCQNVKCQNVQCRRVSHTLYVCLTLRSRSAKRLKSMLTLTVTIDQS